MPKLMLGTKTMILFSRRNLFGLLASAMMVVLSAPANALANDPRTVIETLVNGVAEDLQANGDHYRDDPAALRVMIKENLSRYADLELFSRLVLAKYWRDATPDQLQRFQGAFESYLMQQYGSALLSYNGETVAVSDAIVDANRPRATVPTVLSGAELTAKVDYKLIDREKNGDWRIYDVVLEGLSVVQNFRNGFQDVLSNDGIDRLIELLQEKNDQFINGTAND
ncbi:ABC transporter substrate-binding protein [Gammaproteobacteria bacterium]|nr:ABC transporter substrate-binding protein [Gammaproteobacteria bacterium]